MPSSSTVELPPQLVAGAVRSLLTMYGSYADALRLAVDRYLRGEAPFDELDDARQALWGCESALDQLGWQLGERLEALELSAPPGLLHDCLVAALVASAEDLADVTRDYTRAAAGLAALHAAFERLVAHHDLLTRHERRSAT